MSEPVATMNLAGDYAPENTTCSFCTTDPFEPVKATCFGIRDGESEPSFGCDTCCDHKDDGPCSPANMPCPCNICHSDSAALFGTSYCYGCQSHVCPACVAKAPSLPERHVREQHPPAL